MTESKYKNRPISNFRSNLEKTCADLLRQNNIWFKYEPWQVVLSEKFAYDLPSYERIGNKFKQQSMGVRSISYTPDFVGKRWILETKGKKTPDFMIKWKLFKKYLKTNDLHYTLFMPTTKKEIIESIQIIKNL